MGQEWGWFNNATQELGLTIDKFVKIKWRLSLQWRTANTQ